MDLSTVNLQAEFRKFLFGFLEVFVVVAPANSVHMEMWERTSQQLTCKLNFLQAEFRKFLFGYLEVVVGPAN